MRTTRIVAGFLLTLGCGSSPASVDADGASTTGAAPEPYSDTTVVLDSDSTSGGGGPAGGDWGGCSRGANGCHCEPGECRVGLVCLESTCRPAPQCGDGRLQAPEVCDDGNNDSGDGCSNLCRWERHCFVGQLGDGAGTVRTASIDPDGLLALEGDRSLPVLQPAPIGLTHSIARCGRRLFHATHSAGVIVSLGPFETLPPDSSGAPLEGVLELACADETLLFATMMTGEGFELQLFDIREELVPLEARVLDATGPPRLALDEENEQVWLALPGSPLRIVSLSYAGLTLGPSEPVATETGLTDADDLAWIRARGSLLVASGRVDQQTVLMSVRDIATAVIDLPWSDRNNIAELSDGIFAMGGASGVALGSVDENGAFAEGTTLAPELTDTLVRAAMLGSILVVASPAELRTYRVEAPDVSWQELDRVSFDSPQLEAGDIVPCR